MALEEFVGGSPRGKVLYICDLEVLCLLQEGKNEKVFCRRHEGLALRHARLVKGSIVRAFLPCQGGQKESYCL
ncbi:hypothetical protein MA16_Dca026112 [Dendrobium catenatum]|uniref:Uncharacterized protein n=1 Tax=Dendrobium catenatum TaxID=906689 RepID=A0A2I0W4E2_9ASPA|nr:hypothetical protein MA16_Dca026112 [Dendrobium catenatum]